MVRAFSCVAALALAPAASAFMGAPVLSRVGASSALSMSDRSIAIPFDKKPENLDGSMVGDVGFDPAGFSNNPPRPWLIGGEGRSLKWYQEAEIVHSRVAMLAALGWVTPEFYHFPGNADVGMDAFAETMPFKALSVVPAAGLWQIAAAMFAVEVFRINRVIRGDAPAGDLGLGQGEGARWNPFGLNYDADEFKAMQLREIKNGRLAMIGIMGMFLQASATGTGLIEQLSGGFSVPEAAAKAGYYFPGGL